MKPAGALDAMSSEQPEELLGAVAHEQHPRDRVQSEKSYVHRDIASL